MGVAEARIEIAAGEAGDRKGGELPADMAFLSPRLFEHGVLKIKSEVMQSRQDIPGNLTRMPRPRPFTIRTASVGRTGLWETRKERREQRSRKPEVVSSSEDGQAGRFQASERGQDAYG